MHLEILRDRLEIEYGIKTQLGDMQVAYRESVARSASERVKVERHYGNQLLFAEIEIELEPLNEGNELLVHEEE